MKINYVNTKVTKSYGSNTKLESFADFEPGKQIMPYDLHMLVSVISYNS